MNAMMVGIRVMFALYLLTSGQRLAQLYGAAEFWLCIMAFLNYVNAKRWDRGADARWMIVLYLACYFVRVDHVEPSAWLTWGVGVYLTLVTLLRSYFCSSFSVGVANWVQLRAGGPYRLIRHPLLLLEVLGRWLFVLGNPSVPNVGSAIVFAMMCVAMIVVEERFLKTVPEWCEYAAGVRWRLIPRVW